MPKNNNISSKSQHKKMLQALRIQKLEEKMKSRLFTTFFFVQLISSMEIEISIIDQELRLKDDNVIVLNLA